MTRKEKVEMLQYYCDNKNFTCLDCPLYQKYDEETDQYTEDHGCVFEDMDNEMLDKIYGWYKEIDQVSCENAEDSCCNKEPNVDMVNHHKNIVEEMRRLFDLFDDNVEIFINKSNKTVDIYIKM